MASWSENPPRCVACPNRAQSQHHLDGGTGRKSSPTVPLCGTGTTGCHGKITDHSNGWRDVAQAIRDHVAGDPALVEFVDKTMGRPRFNRRYPQLICDAEIDGYLGSRAWCVRPRGHEGPHAPLTAEEFQSRDEERFNAPREWEALEQ